MGEGGGRKRKGVGGYMTNGDGNAQGAGRRKWGPWDKVEISTTYTKKKKKKKKD
jgi:hypothetical protein